MSNEAATPLPADIARHPRPSQWVRVAADGHIEVFAGKVELGQGVAVMQWQVAADELDADPAMVTLSLGDTASCPDQGLTAGSLSTEVGAMALRRVCAEVRQRFVAAAAARLGVAADAVVVAGGRFGSTAGNTTGGATLGYGDLAAEVDLEAPLRGDAVPKPAARRRWAEQPLPRPDLHRKLFGAGFIHDIEWPGMLHGRAVRPPSLRARLLGTDAAALQAVRELPGVATVHIEGGYIAVAAEREEQAIAAAEALRGALRWADGEYGPDPDAEQSWLRQRPAEHSVIDASGPDAAVGPADGAATAAATGAATGAAAGAAIDAAADTAVGAAHAASVAAAAAMAAAAAHRFEADYSRPFIAHASIGPSCALARWQGNDLIVCTHSQGVFTLRLELARLFGIAPARVHVSHADGAGCYGHNGADDAAIDAAILARAAGRPVRLQWSRADELAWSPFGSAMSVRIAATLDAQGRIRHWQHEVWSHSHVQRPGLAPQLSCLAAALREPPAPAPPLRDFPLPAGGGQRNAVPIYALPVRRIDYHLVAPSNLRTSALRALGAHANVFAIESAMDELAQLAGQDPLAFRLAHLDDPRAAAVLRCAAAMAGWSQPMTAPPRDAGAARGRGIGLARYKNSGAWCAVVAEIELSERIRLDRVFVAVDAGEVVHRDGLLNQVEGGVLQAASWTLKEAVPFNRQGAQVQGWDDYPILGFDELPSSLQVQLIEEPGQPPLGVGECAAGPTAAALANALADALGVRARHLPLTPERLLALIAG